MAISNYPLIPGLVGNYMLATFLVTGVAFLLHPDIDHAQSEKNKLLAVAFHLEDAFGPEFSVRVTLQAYEELGITARDLVNFGQTWAEFVAATPKFSKRFRTILTKVSPTDSEPIPPETSLADQCFLTALQIEPGNQAAMQALALSDDRELAKRWVEQLKLKYPRDCTTTILDLNIRAQSKSTLENCFLPNAKYESARELGYGDLIVSSEFSALLTALSKKMCCRQRIQKKRELWRWDNPWSRVYRRIGNSVLRSEGEEDDRALLKLANSMCQLTTDEFVLLESANLAMRLAVNLTNNPIIAKDAQKETLAFIEAIGQPCLIDADYIEQFKMLSMPVRESIGGLTSQALAVHRNF